jgi:putative nucleotidyltransferase with HDIG domain/PAS domain S-box-containing protein
VPVPSGPDADLGELRFFSIVEHSTDFVVLLDARGRVSYANPAAEALLGAPDRKLHRILARVHAEDRARVEATFVAVRDHSGPSLPVEGRFAASDGTWRTMHAVLTNRLDDPSVRGIVLNARDFTETAGLIRMFRTITECNQVLVRASDEDQLIHDMCGTIVDKGGYELAWVGYPEQDAARTVRIAAAAGVVEMIEHAVVTWAEDDPRGRGPVGVAIRTASQQTCDDTFADARFGPWRELVIEYGMRSSIAFPLLSEQRVLGVVSIYSKVPRAFDGPAVELLGNLVDDLAFGIRRLRDLERLDQSLEGAITAVAALGEVRDPYTAGHQRRVADLAASIATRLGMDDEEVRAVDVAGSLHDIGKVYVPSEFLTRPGGLSPTEFELVKTHSAIGADIIKSIQFPWPVAEVVRQHHERLDGSGYPRGLARDEILPAARVLAVADTVEAMAHFRPYRPALGLPSALDEIRRNRGILFDDAVADACVSLFSDGTFEFAQ